MRMSKLLTVCALEVISELVPWVAATGIAGTGTNAHSIGITVVLDFAVFVNIYTRDHQRVSSSVWPIVHGQFDSV